MNDSLMLVGSVPLETAKEVLETFGGALGPHLRWMPDGEVGPRKHGPTQALDQPRALPGVRAASGPGGAASAAQGAYCGFGRVPPEQMPGVLEEHRQTAKLLGGRRG